MKVVLKYGLREKVLHIPQEADIAVLKAAELPILNNVEQTLERVLTHPIGCEPFENMLQAVKPKKVSIAVPDETRPVPIKEILPILHGDALTVTGKTVKQNVANAETRDREIIRTMSDPWRKEGGLAVLRGNLAPNTAITKPAAIVPEMHNFTGKARCFNNEGAANEAILDGKVHGGEVVVIRYEGPKGGPGMREMYTAMKLLYGRGLALKTALVTDGRFSGTNNGCFVGHISPEAAEGGPIAIVEDGDRITIDIPNRSVQLHVSEEEIQTRLARWQRPEPKIKKGYLALYGRLAESADKGAIIRHKIE